MLRTVARWTNDDAASALCSGDAELHRVALAHHGIVVDASERDGLGAQLDFEPLARRGVIVAIHGGEPANIAPSADLWLADTTGNSARNTAGESDLERFVRLIDTFPLAAVVCARQLRLADACNLAERVGAQRAVEIESLAYATLQAGPEFASWLAQQGRRVRPDNEANIVIVDEQNGPGGAAVHLALNRPRFKNSLNAALRDRLLELLDALSYRTDVASITLTGNGSSFCIGGDLAEFGVVSDSTNAHLIRLATSLPARLLGLEVDLHVQAHGAVVGAGVELAAFADSLVADPGTTFRLPEVSMGLLPGAGGTVSVTRRIGRQQAARLLLLDRTIDTTEALDIGLIDAIEATTEHSRS